jgi:hypothetical protein
MKYTTEYCRNNKVAIQVNSEEEYNTLTSILPINNPYREGYCYRVDDLHSCFGAKWFYEQESYEIITLQQFMQSQIKYLEDFTDKDVIHCPTLELSIKITGLLKDYPEPFNSPRDRWENYKENLCLYPFTGGYSDVLYYNERGCTIHKAEDILALYEQKQMKQNLDEYIVECETLEESNIVASHIKGINYDCLSVFRYVINFKKFGKNVTLYGHIPTICEHLPILTFKQFQQQIMKETKKIIGYKCPISLFNGEVEKGTLFVKLSHTMYEAQSPIKEVRTMKFLPKEIVETWVAVLGDEFKIGDFVKQKHWKIWTKVLAVDKYSITISDGTISTYSNVEDFVKATQAEIDFLFSKTLTLSNGKEVIVNKGVIKANNEIVTLESWKNLLITGKKVNSYDVELTDATFKIGCWTGVKLADIQLIIKTAEEQIELM